MMVLLANNCRRMSDVCGGGMGCNLVFLFCCFAFCAWFNDGHGFQLQFQAAMAMFIYVVCVCVRVDVVQNYFCGIFAPKHRSIRNEKRKLILKPNRIVIENTEHKITLTNRLEKPIGKMN